jgi:predicted alpha/beta-hydrolase family hydrolase
MLRACHRSSCLFAVRPVAPRAIRVMILCGSHHDLHHDRADKGKSGLTRQDALRSSAGTRARLPDADHRYLVA